MLEGSKAFDTIIILKRIERLLVKTLKDVPMNNLAGNQNKYVL